MTSDMLAFLSILVVVALLAVLCTFLALMTRVVRSAANTLSAVSDLNAGITEDCRGISPATEGMNLVLYGVAANLADLGDAAEALPAGLASQGSSSAPNRQLGR